MPSPASRRARSWWDRRAKKSAPPGPPASWRGPARVACWTCARAHALPADPRQALASAQGFFERHLGHAVNWFEAPALAGVWTPNADVKGALQSEQTMTVTNLHSLASSPTAGWGSASVDNTANLFLEALVQAVLDPANTAPANSKAFFVYAYHGSNSGDLTTTGAATGGTPGSEGALTFPDVTTNPVGLGAPIGMIPYVNADVVQKSRLMSVMGGGPLSPFWGVALVNHSGAALAASGNTMKYRGVYATVI